MNRKNILWIILDLIFLVVFNVLFFVLGGTKHELSAWIAYVFIHFAYLMLIITPFLLRNCSRTDIFGFAVYLVSSVYFIMVFVINVVFISINFSNSKICIAVNTVLAGIYGIMLVAQLIANENTADSIQKHETELEYVRNCSSRLKSIENNTTDKELRKKVETIYDLIHSSPVKSDSSVKKLETRIAELIGELEKTNTGDSDEYISVINEIKKNAEERNRKLLLRQ